MTQEKLKYIVDVVGTRVAAARLINNALRDTKRKISGQRIGQILSQNTEVCMLHIYVVAIDKVYKQLKMD